MPHFYVSAAIIRFLVVIDFCTRDLKAQSMLRHIYFSIWPCRLSYLNKLLTVMQFDTTTITACIQITIMCFVTVTYVCTYCTYLWQYNGEECYD